MKATLCIPFTAALLYSCADNNVKSNAADSSYAITAAIPSSFSVTDSTGLPVEIIREDINHDGINDSIILELPPVKGDPGQFQKITLAVSGAKLQTYSTKEAWDVIDSSFEKSNTISSKRIYLYRHSTDVFVLLFGWLYGSGRDNFNIIRFRNNQWQQLFADQMDEPVAIQEMGQNKQLCFIGRISGPDSRDGQSYAYAPYLVYNIDDSGQIDEALSKVYNEAHYVWAGLKYNDTIKVKSESNSFSIIP